MIKLGYVKKETKEGFHSKMKNLRVLLASIIVLFILIIGTNNIYATSKTKAEINEERSNNYLESLSVEGYDITPEFNKFNQTYYLTIPSSVKSLNVIAKCEKEEAKYRVSGNTNLANNENTINVVVTSQNRLTRTYKIIVTKEINNGLKLNSLDIEGVTLAREFTSDNHNYNGTATFSKDETELKINAIANVSDASIEILGNKVVQGNNLITIILRSGNKTSVYQIYLDVTVEKTITTEIKNNSFIEDAKNKITEFMKDENKVMALLIAVAAVLLILVIILITKISKGKKVSKNKENLKKRAK